LRVLRSADDAPKEISRGVGDTLGSFHDSQIRYLVLQADINQIEGKVPSSLGLTQSWEIEGTSLRATGCRASTPV
jgi:hypothetical protein